MTTHQCPGCSYRYNEAIGEPHEGLGPGTALADIPSELSCPDCGVREFVDFEPVNDAEATT